MDNDIDIPIQYLCKYRDIEFFITRVSFSFEATWKNTNYWTPLIYCIPLH